MRKRGGDESKDETMGPRRTLRWVVGLIIVAGVLYAYRPQDGAKVLIGESAGLELRGPFLGSPGGQSADLLFQEGRVVVVDFWATWCAPCLETIPEINGLVEYFRDKPVTFVSVTDEDLETVASFLKKQKILSIVAMDTKRAMFRRFNVSAIPAIVIIGKDGKVAPSPELGEFVTAEYIQELLDKP